MTCGCLIIVIDINVSSFSVTNITIKTNQTLILGEQDGKLVCEITLEGDLCAMMNATVYSVLWYYNNEWINDGRKYNISVEMDNGMITSTVTIFKHANKGGTYNCTLIVNDVMESTARERLCVDGGKYYVPVALGKQFISNLN